MRRSLLFALVVSCRAPAPSPEPAIQVGQVLAGDDSGFARALGPRAFEFPADHGPHPEFRSEWWYLTGHLRAGERRFGYQFTIFRQALAPAAEPRASAWATRQAYMAHLAVTDEAGHRFVAFERLARDGARLAGADRDSSGWKLWVEDWSMQPELPIQLHAREPGQVELALRVDPGRGPVLQGEGGLSRKGPEPGNASYYYSCTRLPTSGSLRIGDHEYAVSGESWLDREWSTSALGPELAGWDWLALDLSDGRDLMVYRLRRKDGGVAGESRATLIEASGATHLFGPEAFRMTPRSFWTSTHTGARYPVSVLVEIPEVGLRVETHPLLEDQELRLSFRYWEGAVSAVGRAGAAITGSGYLELTGYAP